MSNKATENTLRDRYFSNDIFKIGDLVEDISTGEQMKILDRGSNYVTVATKDGIVKKWLDQIIEEIIPNNVEAVDMPVKTDSEFTITESGQISLYGYCTKNFDIYLSEFILEQFNEFADLYSKHQIIKCLDIALRESDTEKSYSLLEKIGKFYSTQNIEPPILVEVMKNDAERTRIAEILATIANVPISNSNNQTVNNSIKSLKEKYQTKKQWEVLMPFLKMARDSGLVTATQNLPYSLYSMTEECEIIFDVMEENLDLVVSDLTYSDIEEAFDESDFCDDFITEVLSIEDRNKLAIKLKQEAPVLGIKRERAMSRGASSAVLMQRARRLAEVMLKRRMFHKSVGDMTRQEKERFESGAGGRRAVIARLAQKLIGKVRMLQTTRLHHSDTPVSHTHDKATATINNRIGAT